MVTTSEQRDLIEEFREAFPFLITVEDTMRFTLGLHEEYKRWRKIAELARRAWQTDSWIEFNDAYLEAVGDE